MNLIAGVDEAGRGCIAGPVVAAAVILGKEKILGLDDSKKISDHKRIKISEEIRVKSKCFSFGVVSSKIIDKINIKQASILAMKRAVSGLKVLPTEIIVDGIDSFEADCPVKALVKADNLILEVMAASIIAKVYRDKLMSDLDEKHPVFFFSSHKGYPTKKHIDAINTYGIINEHRKTFRPVKKINE